jgi:hypothetical protein
MSHVLFCSWTQEKQEEGDLPARRWCLAMMRYLEEVTRESLSLSHQCTTLSNHTMTLNSVT